MTAIPGKQAAFGTILKGDALAGDAPGTYRNIAFVKALKGPGITLELADVTSHDSTGGWEELVATVLRTGELTAEIFYDPAGVTVKYVNGLIGKMVAKTLLGFKMYFPNDTVEASRSIWTFNAYVIGFEPDMPFDGALTANLKFKISSVPTLV